MTVSVGGSALVNLLPDYDVHPTSSGGYRRRHTLAKLIPTRLEGGVVASRMHPHRLHGGALGATIGAIVGLIAILVIDRFVRGDQNDTYWAPAGIVVGIFAGGMVGHQHAEISNGGREDEAATAEAEAALAEQDGNHEPPIQQS